MILSIQYEEKENMDQTADLEVVVFKFNVELNMFGSEFDAEHLRKTSDEWCMFFNEFFAKIVVKTCCE